MKVRESYVDKWFKCLQEKLINEAIVTKYQNIFLGSYCFAVKDPDRAKDEFGNNIPIIQDNLNLLNTILETHQIKVSKTREFNITYDQTQYAGRDKDIDDAFDSFKRAESKANFDDAEEALKTLPVYRAEIEANTELEPKDKEKELKKIAKKIKQAMEIHKTSTYFKFSNDLSYKDYLAYRPSDTNPKLLKSADAVVDPKINHNATYETKIHAGEERYKKELNDFKTKGRFVSFSVHLTGHTIRDKWAFGVIVDLKHLASGDIDKLNSQHNINLHDNLYIIDHADNVKIRKLSKSPVKYTKGRKAILPCSIQFDNITPAEISLSTYTEVLKFLDDFVDPRSYKEKTDGVFEFAYQAGPTLREYQKEMGEDSDLMQDLLNSPTGRTDSPYDEKELRYWLSLIDKSDYLDLDDNIVGVILPYKKEKKEGISQDDFCPEILANPALRPDITEQLEKLNSFINSQSLAVVWAENGEIAEVQKPGLIGKALDDYILNIKNNL